MHATPHSPSDAPAPSGLDALRQLLTLRRDQPELLRAQYRAYTTLAPLLYVVLLFNIWLLVSSFLDKAPAHLTLWTPGALSLACLARLAAWWRKRHVDPDADAAHRGLTLTNRITGLLTATFTFWALSLFKYGGALQQAHVALFVALSVVACITCLMSVRQSMLIVGTTGIVIFLAFFLTTGVPAFVAMAFNVVLTTAVLMVVLTGHHHNFVRLIKAQLRSEQLSSENLRLANQDPLTRLNNRRGFFTRLDERCIAARREGRRFAVGILDIDGFKPVNDLHGHATGDQLLREVGDRLRALATPGMHMARLGGDEFGLIIDQQSDEALLAFGQQVCAVLRRPFHLGESTLQVAASMGLVTYPDLASNATDLYEYADYALYHGKRNNRGTANLFSTQHRELIQQDAVTEQTLRQANFERELSVLFQPIVDARGGQTLAFEALARWTSPTLGTVSPARFIPVAERAGLVSLQTHALLKKALAAAAQWPAPVRLSFNLSAHDLAAPEVVARLIDLIAASGFSPERLDLEITETAIMQDMEQVRWAVNQFRSLGCGMTLDDFGTGFSSLSQLHALPLTKIKIDRRFVSGIQNNPASYKIVKSLLALSRDMGLGCVIEGVETTEELSVIRALGGAMVQGYLYARPMPMPDIGRWLASAPVADAANANAAADTAATGPDHAERAAPAEALP